MKKRVAIILMTLTLVMLEVPTFAASNYDMDFSIGYDGRAYIEFSCDDEDFDYFGYTVYFYDENNSIVYKTTKRKIESSSYFRPLLHKNEFDHAELAFEVAINGKSVFSSREIN